MTVAHSTSAADNPDAHPSSPFYNTDLNLPYWNVNVPPQDQTIECPIFLLNLSDKDKHQLSTPNHLYQPLSWPAVQTIVHENRLQDFTRVPTDLRLYREFVHNIVNQHGSITRYIAQKRLRWEEPVRAKGRSFECEEEDVRVERNDWPYGLDPRIVHLVVWTKFELEDDEVTGFPTEEARQGIEGFMERRVYSFVEDREKVLWFKNWSALKSVHAVEHFHIMMFDVDTTTVEAILGRNS